MDFSTRAVADVGHLMRFRARRSGRRGHRWVLGVMLVGTLLVAVVPGFGPGAGDGTRALSVLLAALHEPQVLLLDEPFDGVDPIGVEATLDVIGDARARGACVLVSTHLRELAVQACGNVLVLRGGSRVATMDAVDMIGDEGARAYRGLLD